MIGRVARLLWRSLRYAVGPVQSPETRRYLALQTVAWGLAYQFTNLLGDSYFFRLSAHDTASLSGIALIVVAVWLWLTMNGRRATWKGRFAAIFGIGVLINLAVLVWPVRWPTSVVYLVAAYGLLGEALVLDDAHH